MARPTKWRKIDNFPVISYYIPSKEAAFGAEKNVLLVEELEAVRLKDLLELEQEECALRMQISRPTFQRILLSARKKIADSLINGKTIHISGGSFTSNICTVKCADCGKEWNESYENLSKSDSGEYVCPACGSKNVACESDGVNKFCRKKCCRRRFCNDI